MVAWLHPDPLGELTALPRPLAGLGGEMGGEWTGEGEGRGKGGRGKGREEKGEERKERTPPPMSEVR